VPQLGIVFMLLAFTNPLVKDVSHFQGVYLIPVIVAGIIGVLALATLKVSQRVDQPPKEQVSLNRWVGISCTLLAFLIGMFLSLSILRSTFSLTSALVAWVVSVIIGCYLAYLSSHNNPPERPDLMRWVVLFVMLLSSYLSFEMILMLIYYIGPNWLDWGVPGVGSIPVIASLMTLAYVPPALVIVVLIRNSAVRPV